MARQAAPEAVTSPKSALSSQDSGRGGRVSLIRYFVEGTGWDGMRWDGMGWDGLLWCGRHLLNRLEVHHALIIWTTHLVVLAEMLNANPSSIHFLDDRALNETTCLGGAPHFLFCL